MLQVGEDHLAESVDEWLELERVDDVLDECTGDQLTSFVDKSITMLRIVQSFHFEVGPLAPAS